MKKYKLEVHSRRKKYWKWDEEVIAKNKKQAKEKLIGQYKKRRHPIPIIDVVIDEEYIWKKGNDE